MTLEKIKDKKRGKGGRGCDKYNSLTVCYCKTRPNQASWPQFTDRLCTLCLLVTMVHSEHCQGIIICELVFPWIYNVVIVNNTLLEATVYITDRKAFGVCFSMNGVVLQNVCGCHCARHGCHRQKPKMQFMGKDVTVQSEDNKKILWLYSHALNGRNLKIKLVGKLWTRHSKEGKWLMWWCAILFHKVQVK